MEDVKRREIFEDFKKMITTESVVGQPIYLGDATIVPFVDVSFGFGTGQTGADGKTTGGAGGGRMTPTAVLILKGERVELFSIKNAASTTTIDKVLNMVPEVVSHFRKKKETQEAAPEEKAAPEKAAAQKEAAPEQREAAPETAEKPAPEGGEAKPAEKETGPQEEIK